MADHQPRVFAVAQQLDQPVDPVVVQVVGRLIKDPQIGRCQQQLRKAAAVLLTATELRGVGCGELHEPSALSAASIRAG